MSKIVAWSIAVEYEDGKETELTNVPNDVAQAIDDWLSEVENNDHTEM
jgi:hypothetical protein